MRVRIAVAVFVVVLICSAAVPAVAAPMISFSPSPGSVNVGDTFTIDVNVSDVTDLYGFQFDFNFDPLRVSPSAVTEGLFLSQGVSGSTDFQAGTNNGAGTIEFTLGFLLGAVPGVSGSGTLATLAFTATGQGSAAFSLSDVILLDSVGELLDAGMNNEALVNINATAVPEPTSLMLIGTGLAMLARRRAAAAAPTPTRCEKPKTYPAGT